MIRSKIFSFCIVLFYILGPSVTNGLTINPSIHGSATSILNQTVHGDGDKAYVDGTAPHYPREESTCSSATNPGSESSLKECNGQVPRRGRIPSNLEGIHNSKFVSNAEVPRNSSMTNKLQKRTKYKDRERFKVGRKDKPKKDPKGGSKGGSKKVPKKELKKDPKKDGGRKFNEKDLVKNLMELDPGFVDLDRTVNEEEDNYFAEYEASDDENYDDFDYVGSEDEELYELAIKRARSTLIPMMQRRTDLLRDLSSIFIRRSEVLNHHPTSSILKAMGLSEKIFSPDSATFVGINLELEHEDAVLLQAMVSLSQKHLVLDWSDDETIVDGLAHWMYFCWRSGFLGGTPGGEFHANQVPRSPGAPLEYITINNIVNKRTITVLSRVSELPGRRLKNYRDPEQKRTRNAYFFDTEILGRYHDESEEKKAIDALFGSTEIRAIQEMLEGYPQGPDTTKLSSIFFVIDHDANNPSAMVLVQLLPQSPGSDTEPDRSVGDFELDKQPPGIDPRLIVTQHDSLPKTHPYIPPLPGNGPSYFEASAEYVLNPTERLNFRFSYSILENHLVLAGLDRLGEKLSNHDAEISSKILYSAWTRQAGLVPILRITFIGMSAASSAIVKAVVGDGQNGVPQGIILNSSNNMAGLMSVVQKLEAEQSREVKIAIALMELNKGNFGQNRLVQLALGIDGDGDAFLIFTMEYSEELQFGGENLYGAANNPFLVALRRGTRLKAEMELLEPIYQDDEPGIREETANPTPSSGEEYRKSDLSVGSKDIAKYTFVPDLDSKSFCDVPDQTHPIMGEVLSWDKKLGKFTDDKASNGDEVQLLWRKKVAAAFGGMKVYCRFSLSKNSHEQVFGNDNSRTFEFLISHDSGHIVLPMKFPEFDRKVNPESTLIDLEDAIWALWIAVDTSGSSRSFPQQYQAKVKNRITGLRYVTILRPSDETIQTLQLLYTQLSLSTSQIIIFPSQDSGLELLPDHPTTEDNIRRRILLALNGLPEVYAIDDLCRRNFYKPYSLLNYRRRVGAVIIKWVGDQPQLVIALGHFTFERPTEGMMKLETLSRIRERSDLTELTEAGCEIAWSSASSYLFELSDLILAASQNVGSEYNIEETGYILGCPEDIKGFLGRLPWAAGSDIRRQITQEEVADLTRLVKEEISAEEQHAFTEGKIGQNAYRSYTYTYRYHPLKYQFLVRGSPYHLIVGVTNDEQAGLPTVSRIARIERLSRAYYDLFLRTAELMNSAVSDPRWVSMYTHHLSFETATIVRKLWNIMSLRVTNWRGFDISFTRGPNPTIKDKEEIQIGKTLLGLVEIGGLGRMLSDHARAMQNLRISRILINTAPDEKGVPDSSFQIVIVLRPQVFMGALP
ncbi:hypothetical protein TWF281_000595 [Arthrobotrys megalospora]